MQKKLLGSMLQWPVSLNVHEAQFFYWTCKILPQICIRIRPKFEIIIRYLPFKDVHSGNAQQAAFGSLTVALTGASVFCYPDANKLFTVTTDASQYAVGTTIIQDGHPISYLSHRLTKSLDRRDMGDQEVRAFLALREWRVCVYGRHFIFEKDHEPLRYFQSKAQLSGCQRDGSLSCRSMIMIA